MDKTLPSTTATSTCLTCWTEYSHTNNHLVVRCKNNCILCNTCFNAQIKTYLDEKMEIKNYACSFCSINLSIPALFKELNEANIINLLEQTKHEEATKVRSEELIRFTAQQINNNKKTELQKKVDGARIYIEETILTLKCPTCSKAVLNYNGCLAFVCGDSITTTGLTTTTGGCGTGFCGICFKACGKDAHKHVENVHGSYSMIETKWNEEMIKRKVTLFKKYWTNEITDEVRQCLVKNKAICSYFKDLGIGYDKHLCTIQWPTRRQWGQDAEMRYIQHTGFNFGGQQHNNAFNFGGQQHNNAFGIQEQQQNGMFGGFGNGGGGAMQQQNNGFGNVRGFGFGFVQQQNNAFGRQGQQQYGMFDRVGFGNGGGGAFERGFENTAAFGQQNEQKHKAFGVQQNDQKQQQEDHKLAMQLQAEENQRQQGNGMFGAGGFGNAAFGQQNVQRQQENGMGGGGFGNTAWHAANAMLQVQPNKQKQQNKQKQKPQEKLIFGGGLMGGIAFGQAFGQQNKEGGGGGGGGSFAFANAAPQGHKTKRIMKTKRRERERR